MAKPIRATPELRGKEAREFVKNMISTERTKITKKDIELAKSIEHSPF